MTDIVERLYNDAHHFNYGVGAKLEEAAAEIERLRADNARLRGIIENVTASWFDLSLGEEHMNGVIDEACRALEAKDD